MDPKERYILITEYFNGTLSKEQQAAVAAKLAGDKEWQAVAEDVRQGGSNHKGGTVSHHWKQKRRRLKKLRRIISFSAVVLFLFLSWLAYLFFTLTPDRIFNATYIEYRVPPLSDSEMQRRNFIEEIYRTDNYSLVIRQAKRLKSFSQKELLLVGLAYMKTGDYLSASNWLIQVHSPYYKPAAQFYLALAYLKNGDFDRSIELMQRIMNSPMHPYNKAFTKKTVRQVQVVKWK